MDVVVTSAAMRACDRRAIDHAGVPSGVLMENAGRAVALAAASILAETGGTRVTLVCGTGNNGGDGFVAARHLLEAGIDVRVVLAGGRGRMSGDSKLNHGILGKLSKEKRPTGSLSLEKFSAGRGLPASGREDVVVDALVGTGFRGPLRGAHRRIVEAINAASGTRIAVDIPSGLDPDTGAVKGACVRAHRTVTMGFLKTGLLVGKGPAYAGKIEIAGLGVPLAAGISGRDRTFRVTPADARAALPVRPLDAHKYSVGRVLIIAGSTGYTGAAALSARAAMRSGAGAVVLAVPESIYPVLARKLSEEIVRPVPGAPDGTISALAFETLAGEISRSDVVVIGPGLGRGKDVGGFFRKLLNVGKKRFVLDADALFHLAEDRALVGILKRNTCILTPHTGEFSRMTGLSAAAIEDNRVELAREWAAKHRTTLVLKGAPTVTALSDRTAWINATGNPGMATAGMGDVLAGMLGGIWAGSGPETSVAWAAVSLHGLAGDRAAARLGERSLLAGDVLNELAQVLSPSNDGGFS